MKKKKVWSKSKYRKEVDKLFSLQVREFGRCEKCGKQSGLQTAHIYSRSNLHLRYDTKNVLCLCSGCHLKAHHEPADFIEWVDHRFPTRLDYLRVEKNKLETNFDWANKYNELKNV